jgi:hypothetical protein
MYDCHIGFAIQGQVLILIGSIIWLTILCTAGRMEQSLEKSPTHQYQTPKPFTVPRNGPQSYELKAGLTKFKVYRRIGETIGTD